MATKSELEQQLQEITPWARFGMIILGIALGLAVLGLVVFPIGSLYVERLSTFYGDAPIEAPTPHATVVFYCDGQGQILQQDGAIDSYVLEPAVTGGTPQMPNLGGFYSSYVVTPSN